MRLRLKICEGGKVEEKLPMTAESVYRKKVPSFKKKKKKKKREEGF